MSYSRLWGGGAWYIYKHVSGHVHINFDKTADRYTDGKYLMIRENQHVVPLLAALVDQLTDNVTGTRFDSTAKEKLALVDAEPPTEDEWRMLADVHAAISAIERLREKIGTAPPRQRYVDGLPPAIREIFQGGKE